MHDLNVQKVLRGGLAGWQVKAILRLAAARVGELTVGGLAAEVKLSPDHFGRAFSVSFGCPPRAWLLLRRMESARERLETTRDSLDQIAADLGYKSSSQFCRAFRHQYGESPTSFRRV